MKHDKNTLNRAIAVLDKAIDRSEIRKKKIQEINVKILERKNENNRTR